MATGYLVTLGDGSLDTGDSISGSQSTFTASSTIGTGSWTWTGVWDGDGQTYSNIPDTGTYFLGTDGNVYFTPDTWYTTSGTANVDAHPAYTSSDGIVSGTSGADLIDLNYTGDTQGDVVTDGDDTIKSGLGNDTIYAGTGDDSVSASAGNDTIFGEAGNDWLVGESGDDVIEGGIGDDLIFGGTGNDRIDGGADNDIINGGTGADTLSGGEGADRFVLEAGFGNDTITGGEAGLDNDTIWSTQGINTTTVLTGDEAGTITDGTSTATFSEIEVVNVGAGNDTVDASASDADITVYGNAGADTITGSTADDVIYGGNDHDTIIGDESGETIGDNIDGAGLTQDVTVTFTGAESGTISNGSDIASFAQIEKVETGSGDDTVIGNVGAQNVSTGTGNDTITTTGTGADTIDTGAGDDTIVFSEGDSINGGEGDDTFTYENLGEPTNGSITIVGGQGGEIPDDGDPNTLEGDTLDLGFDADMSTLNITSTTVNIDGNTSYSGSVTMDDGTILNFSEIENIICFTPGTRIATPKGARDIATLQVGDMVVTRDHGLQPIRWIQSRTVPAIDSFAPIRIRPGVVTGQERDLLVSPQHRMMFQGYRAELLFGESEVLIAAKHLIDGIQVTQDEGGEVTYIHMMFDEHEVVYAEGAATESFHPGDVGLTAISDPARDELLALFPELRTNVNSYGQTARRCLKKHECELLIL